MSLWSFSVDYAWISLFSSFKVIKVKKAALIAGAAFLQMGLFKMKAKEFKDQKV